jgi:hypothetical protein
LSSTVVRLLSNSRSNWLVQECVEVLLLLLIRRMVLLVQLRSAVLNALSDASVLVRYALLDSRTRGSPVRRAARSEPTWREA